MNQPPQSQGKHVPAESLTMLAGGMSAESPAVLAENASLPPTPQAGAACSDPSAADASSVRSSRRSFLGGAGRKALYVTPAVLTLAARPAAAASGFECGSQFKHTIGSPCDDTGAGKDCCPVDHSGTPMDCVDPGDGNKVCTAL